LGTQSLVVTALVGPAAERLFFGGSDDGGDIDRRKALEILAECFSEAEVPMQFRRMEVAAARLLRDHANQVQAIAAALLRHGSMSAADIEQELLGVCRPSLWVS
jgi:hypothetical protein